MCLSSRARMVPVLYTHEKIHDTVLRVREKENASHYWACSASTGLNLRAIHRMIRPEDKAYTSLLDSRIYVEAVQAAPKPSLDTQHTESPEKKHPKSAILKHEAQIPKSSTGLQFQVIHSHQKSLNPPNPEHETTHSPKGVLARHCSRKPLGKANASSGRLPA